MLIIANSFFFLDLVLFANQVACTFNFYQDEFQFYIYSQLILYVAKWNLNGPRTNFIFYIINDFFLVFGLIPSTYNQNYFLSYLFCCISIFFLSIQIFLFFYFPIRRIPFFKSRFNVGYKEIKIDDKLLVAIYYPTHEEVTKDRDEKWIKEEEYYFTILRVFRYYMFRQFPRWLFMIGIGFMKKITQGVVRDAELTSNFFQEEKTYKNNCYFPNYQYHEQDAASLKKKSQKKIEHANAVKQLDQIVQTLAANNPELNILKPIIFSHGFGATRNVYSFLHKSLVSTGKYIIFSIEHEDELWNRWYFNNYDFFAIMFKYIQVKRLPQLKRVVDFLYSENFKVLQKDSNAWFNGKLLLDLRDLSIMGHSYGGASAIYGCIKDYRINGDCIVHDPWITPIENQNLRKDGLKISNTNLLILMSQRFPVNNPDYELHNKIKCLIENKKSQTAVTIIKTHLNSGHNSGSDVVFPLERESKFLKMIAKKSTTAVAKEIFLLFKGFLEKKEIGDPKQFEEKFLQQFEFQDQLKNFLQNMQA